MLETQITTREEWLALRRKNVGGSEVAAIRGADASLADQIDHLLAEHEAILATADQATLPLGE